MSRDYSANKLIALPILSAARAVAVCDSLESQALAKQKELNTAGGEWPKFLERPRVRLRQAATDLEVALRPVEASAAETQAADLTEDHAWRYYYNWEEATVALPDDAAPELAQIRTLHKTLFAEGLEFLTLSYPEEYAESKARLATIEEGGYEAAIKTLGGGLLLSALKDAQAAYGAALNITGETPAPTSPRLAEPLKVVAQAMREYVLKVAAWPDVDEPGSAELAEALLLPLTEWDNPKSGSSAASAGTEGSSEGAGEESGGTEAASGGAEKGSDGAAEGVGSESAGAVADSPE